MEQSTRRIVEELFHRMRSGQPPEKIAALFSETVDWNIAGDVSVVAWIGTKTGRAGVAAFYRQIRDLIISERFEIDTILTGGERAVVLGDLQSRVKKTGKLITSEFAFDLTVRNDQIVRFRMFEDSFAVAQAAV